MCIQNCPGRMDIKDSKSNQQGLNSSHCSFTLMISFILQDSHEGAVHVPNVQIQKSPFREEPIAIKWKIWNKNKFRYFVSKFCRLCTAEFYPA